MLRTAAKALGVVFLLIGILGFIPAFTPDGRLLGIFQVNALHNIIHLLSGIAALAAAYAGAKESRLYFQIFGIVYVLVTVLGLFTGDGYILGIIPNNMADVVLHALIAAGALYFGFVYKHDDVEVPAV